MSSDNYTNLIAEAERAVEEAGVELFDVRDLAQAVEKLADALESVVRDRNEARAKELEKVAEYLDQSGVLMHGHVGITVAKIPFSTRGSEDIIDWLRKRAAAIREEEN